MMWRRGGVQSPYAGDSVDWTFNQARHTVVEDAEEYERRRSRTILLEGGNHTAIIGTEWRCTLLYPGDSRACGDSVNLLYRRT